jgi:L-aminopeptidase/D-esterase-like protein
MSGWQPGKRNAITDVPGIRVGHWTDRRAATGCTVVLCEKSTAVAADARGGAPGTREIDVLAPANIVRRCDAIVLSGGSAFGLAAATGVVRWCSERGIGFPTSARPVPIVSGAVVYDLTVGRADRFPGEAEGYRAADLARAGKVAQGSVGVGTGAIVGRMLGGEFAMKGGFGTASVAGPRGIVVGAMAVTNAVGHIYDPETGTLIAGPREQDGRMVPLPEALFRRTDQMDAIRAAEAIENTTLVCVATNAALDHHAVQRIAYQAHDGMARCIVPCHTFGDGDVSFAIAMGQVEPRPEDSVTVGAMTVRAVEQAILNSVRLATALAGVPAVRE